MMLLAVGMQLSSISGMVEKEIGRGKVLLAWR
jgi:hypothetical protein